MTAAPARAPRVHPAAVSDSGFTLIELLIAIVLSSLIAGVTVAALSTSTNIISSVTDQVADSTDANLISTFLYSDAQSAGSVDPLTAVPESTVGVSVANTTVGWSNCQQAGNLVVRFSWVEHRSPTDTTTVVTTYALDAAKQLTRRTCRGSTTADVPLGRAITTATATCAPDPTCATSPRSISLAITGSGARAPYSYTLSASLRRDAQVLPTSATAAAVPLLALGETTSARVCPDLTLSSTGGITIMGDALVSSECGATAVSGSQTVLKSPTRLSLRAGLNDPFRNLVAPATCPATGTNPTPVGDSASATSVVVYPAFVTISTALTIRPGRYVFCRGLTISGSAVVTGPADVLFYVIGGNVSVASTSRVTLTAATSGPYANVVLWVGTAQTVAITGGTRVNSLRGLVYAPLSQVSLPSAIAANIGGVIARDVTFSGVGRTRLGLPIPAVTMSPATLPAGQVGVAYAATTMVGADSTGPYTWVASGLPAGLGINATTGVVSGTPTTAGTYTAILTAFDATSAAASVDYAITIRARPTVSGPATLPNGQVGVTYPTTTMAGTGGQAPYTWSATGLPTGLSIASATGVVSGTVTTAGTFSVVITLRDSVGATATMSYSVTVAEQLTISAPAALPSGGTVGVAFPSTTVSTAGGAAPISWTAAGLPAGLTMDAATGTISGTPTVAGTFSVTVTATDARSASASRTYSLTISPPDSASPAITAPASMPGGRQDVAYTTTTFSGSGGTSPYRWTASGLPPGLTMDATSGAVTGTPTAPGSFTVSIRLDDAAGATASASFPVTIDAAVVVVDPCAPDRSGWTGEYFTNVQLSGTPKFCRLDPSINFSWGTNAPADGIPADNFSIRWTRTVELAADLYTFKMGSDDGSRLYIDGVLVFDRWFDQGYPSSPPRVTVKLEGGAHKIVMEYYERGGGAAATLSWTGSAPLPKECTAAASGWLGQYYDNVSLADSPVMCRDDAKIDFDYGTDAPAAGLPTDNFSMRWTRIQNFVDGTYTFTLGSDDGARLYVDGVVVMDRWFGQGYPVPQPTVNVKIAAGDHRIVLEYYESGGPGRVTLTISP